MDLPRRVSKDFAAIAAADRLVKFVVDTVGNEMQRTVGRCDVTAAAVDAAPLREPNEPLAPTA